jgi:hypothetical protein
LLEKKKVKDLRPKLAGVLLLDRLAVNRNRAGGAVLGVFFR